MNGSDLRNGDLHFGEKLQQKCFKFLICLVDLIDEQHHRLFRTNGFEQRPFQQIFIAEEGSGEIIGILAIPVNLNGQELLLVIPLIKRLALIESLVAL